MHNIDRIGRGKYSLEGGHLVGAHGAEMCINSSVDNSGRYVASGVRVRNLTSSGGDNRF